MGFFGDFQPCHVIIWSHPAEKQPFMNTPPKISIDTETDGLETVTLASTMAFWVFPGVYNGGIYWDASPPKDAGSSPPGCPHIFRRGLLPKANLQNCDSYWNGGTASPTSINQDQKKSANYHGS